MASLQTNTPVGFISENWNTYEDSLMDLAFELKESIITMGFGMEPMDQGEFANLGLFRETANAEERDVNAVREIDVTPATDVDNVTAQIRQLVHTEVVTDPQDKALPYRGLVNAKMSKVVKAIMKKEATLVSRAFNQKDDGTAAADSDFSVDGTKVNEIPRNLMIGTNGQGTKSGTTAGAFSLYNAQAAAEYLAGENIADGTPLVCFGKRQDLAGIFFDPLLVNTRFNPAKDGNVLQQSMQYTSMGGIGMASYGNVVFIGLPTLVGEPEYFTASNGGRRVYFTPMSNLYAGKLRGMDVHRFFVDRLTNTDVPAVAIKGNEHIAFRLRDRAKVAFGRVTPAPLTQA